MENSILNSSSCSNHNSDIKVQICNEVLKICTDISPDVHVIVIVMTRKLNDDKSSELKEIKYQIRSKEPPIFDLSSELKERNAEFEKYLYTLSTS